MDACAEQIAKAQQAYQQRQLEAAIGGFQSAITACPPKPELRVTLGQLLFLEGKEQEAEKSILSALEIDPKHTAANYALGRIYYEQKRYPDAAAQLERVTQIEPANYKAWDNLGLCYDALNQDSKALRAFFKSLDIVMKSHPEYDWAHANLADFFLRRQQYEKAFQLAAEAAKRNPDSARNLFLTGKALVKLDKYDLSVRWLEQAAKVDPDHAEAWYVLSQAYRKLDRKDDAATALQRFQQASKKQKKAP